MVNEDQSSPRGLGSSRIDEQTKKTIQSKGGKASAAKQDMKELGRKGGQTAQKSGKAHRLTAAERSRGGKH